jgi:hypothetical protein
MVESRISTNALSDISNNLWNKGKTTENQCQPPIIKELLVQITYNNSN